MYFLNRLKKQYSNDEEGHIPNEKFKEIYKKIKQGVKII